MLLALAACHKDYNQCLNWSDWVRELGPDYSRHSALVIGSSTITSSDVSALAAKFRIAGFKTVAAIQAKVEETPSWPNAANAMWRLAADWVKDNARVPWTWLESDAIPMQPGWLDSIEAEYFSSKKSFMGTLYPIPFKHLNGVAVYAPNVRRFNPAMFNPEFYALPFDCVRPDLTLREAHISRLFWRGLADPNAPGGGVAHSFLDEASLSIIPPDCAVAHCCKDGSLIQRLREQANPELKTTLQAPEPSLGEKIVSGFKKLVGGHGSAYHSGNLGDTCYALPAMRAAGIKNLIIGPQQRNSAICSVPIDRKQFDMLLPLLHAQSYLRDITYSPTYPTDARDMNHFRTFWNMPHIRERHKIATLCHCHFYELNVLDQFNDRETWLECPNPIQTGKLIIHRSPRYNAPATGPEAFPWQRLVNDHHKDMLFVGLEAEYESFCRSFGKRIGFWRVKDFLELAQLIAGGRCCVMNQSFPLSVALGLGQTVYVEELPRSPDCRFYRDNYFGQLVGPIEIV